MHHCRDLTDLFHQPSKVLGEDRLHAVGERLVRIAMDFNDYSVCAYRNRRASEWSDFVALARSMAWIDHNRQVTQPLRTGASLLNGRLTRR